MEDLNFDIVARDLVMTPDMDFAITENPSVQNAGIIQYSRVSFPTNPMLGIGMEDAVNANNTKTAYEMNRWQAQCIQDGATLAKWSSSIISGGSITTVKILTQISYE